MKLIEKEFTKNSFRFNLVKRIGNTAIFKKTALAGLQRKKEYDAGYEVVEITKHGPYTIAGIDFEAGENYASSESWGSSGFTCTSLEAAEKRFQTMQKKSCIITKKALDFDSSYCKLPILTITSQQNNDMKNKSQTTETVQTAGTTTAVKSTREVTPKLRCIVTNKERLSNSAYLKAKAAAAGISVKEYLSLYISRNALKGLRSGKSVEEVRKELGATYNEPISTDLLARAIRVNGKWSKTPEA